MADCKFGRQTVFVRVNPSLAQDSERPISAANDELKIHGIGELALIATVLLFCEWLLPGPASLTSLSPQPFWIPVLLLSAQYGTASGLIAAVFAMGLSVVAGLPEQMAGEYFYGYLLRIAYEPILWSIAALLIGEIRNRHSRRQKALELMIAEADLQRTNIAENNNELGLHISDLERDIATIEDKSVEAGLERLTRLRAATSAVQIPHLLRESLESFTRSTRYSVYLNANDGLVRDPMLSSGGNDNETVAGKLTDRVARSLNSGTSLSIFNASDPEILSGVGIFANPIIDSEDGKVRGAVVLEMVDADALQPQAELGLAVVCDCLAEAMSAQAAVEQTSAA